MANVSFRLDRKGVGEILKRQETAKVVNAAAYAVQSEVQADVDSDIEVTVEEYTTDRGAAAVTIADPSGIALQAKYGALTRAAARLGLEVTAK